MKDIIFKGCATALVTPFNDSGINYEEVRKMIEFQINGGVDGIVICGTTGESSTMSELEKQGIIKFTVDCVKGRIPVIAGTGSNCTKTAREMSLYAESVGVDAVLVVTPYYNKTTQKGLIEHYKSIADSINIPLILYNVPSRTGLNITPETCFELSKIDNIVAIKEASGNISQIADIKELCKDNLHIYSGNDDQILPILSLGGMGVISVLSNIIPFDVHSMVKKYFDGDYSDAIDIQIKSLKLIRSLFSEVNPIPIKEACNLMGFDVGIPRLPLIKMSNEKMKTLKKEMQNYGIIN